MEDPTQHLPPPPHNVAVTYCWPTVDLPPTSLAALLILQIFFHTFFITTDLAPHVNSEHFGLPGVVDENKGDDTTRKGRRTFLGVGRMMEDVRTKVEALMSWIVEMVDGAYAGLPQS